MPKANINSKQGFTIIEVVLVLAIAGLIFLMVFIAFPALQRSQHDTQRTDDMARVQTALINWQNNHGNKLPGAGDCTYENGGITYDDEKEAYVVERKTSKACEFIKDYMNSAEAEDNTFVDPSGTAYSIVITNNISSGIESSFAKGGKTNVEGINGDKKSALDVSEEQISLDTANSDQDSYVMWIIPGGTCEEDYVVKSARNDFAILYRMEGSGTKCTGSGH